MERADHADPGSTAAACCAAEPSSTATRGALLVEAERVDAVDTTLPSSRRSATRAARGGRRRARRRSTRSTARRTRRCRQPVHAVAELAAAAWRRSAEREPITTRCPAPASRWRAGRGPAPRAAEHADTRSDDVGQVVRRLARGSRSWVDPTSRRRAVRHDAPVDRPRSQPAARGAVEHRLGRPHPRLRPLAAPLDRPRRRPAARRHADARAVAPRRAPRRRVPLRRHPDALPDARALVAAAGGAGAPVATASTGSRPRAAARRCSSSRPTTPPSSCSSGSPTRGAPAPRCSRSTRGDERPRRPRARPAHRPLARADRRRASRRASPCALELSGLGDVDLVAARGLLRHRAAPRVRRGRRGRARSSSSPSRGRRAASATGSRGRSTASRARPPRATGEPPRKPATPLDARRRCRHSTTS